MSFFWQLSFKFMFLDFRHIGWHTLRAIAPGGVAVTIQLERKRLKSLFTALPLKIF